MQPLTPSGCGRLLTPSNREPGELASLMATAATVYGAALVRDLDLSREDFRELAHAAGQLAEHRFGTGSAELLDLDASPHPQKIVTGRAALPLHADGAMVGTRPGLILLYAAEYDVREGFGRTIVCDQASALAQVPSALSAEVLSVDWEYWTEDESHFPTIANRWVRVPPVVTDEDVPGLRIALPFSPDSSIQGWKVRLHGRSFEESEDLLSAFSHFLNSSVYCYRHAWRPGDLLAINNRAVLHGRESIHAGGKRHLYRAQLQ